MSWQVNTLSNLCYKITDGTHDSPKSVSDGFPYIKGTHVKNGLIDFDNCEYLDEKDHLKVVSRSKPEKGDILFANIGGNIGECAYVNVDFEFSIKNVALFKPDTEYLNGKFLYYLLSSDLIQRDIKNRKSGSAQPFLSLKVLRNYKIAYPPIKCQKSIADILSTYDDLIANNLKRIKLLEQAAQNIYKEWFVNMRFPGSDCGPFQSKSELPKEWQIKTVEDVLEKVKRKGKLQKADYQEYGQYPVIDQGDGFIGGFSSSSELVQNESLPIVIFGDHTRRVKYVNFPFISGADGTQLLRPKNKELLPAYFYLAIKSIDLSDYAYARHFKYLKQQKIILPDKHVLKMFNDIVSPILEKVITLDRYNRKLTEGRNVLLPRLMNQTIKV